MPYRRVPCFAGGYYHIYNRGNNRGIIFFERENYLYFLRQVHKYFVSEAVDIIAYCLMPNHYHLLVGVNSDSVNLAGILQPFTVSYTKAINKRFGRVGALFQGRFKAILIDKNEYLIHLSRYLHMNPVNANLVASPEEWEFSSYQEYVGLRASTLVKSETVLSHFPSSQVYRDFTMAYKQSDVEMIKHLTTD